MRGNEKRLSIMNELAGAELSVGMLAGKVLLSQSALSQHLAKLRAFGLVDALRDGKMIYYLCSSCAARELLAMLDGFLVTERLGAGPQYVPTGGTGCEQSEHRDFDALYMWVRGSTALEFGSYETRQLRQIKVSQGWTAVARYFAGVLNSRFAV